MSQGLYEGLTWSISFFQTALGGSERSRMWGSRGILFLLPLAGKWWRQGFNADAKCSKDHSHCHGHGGQPQRQDTTPRALADGLEVRCLCAFPCWSMRDFTRVGLRKNCAVRGRVVSRSILFSFCIRKNTCVGQSSWYLLHNFYTVTQIVKSRKFFQCKLSSLFLLVILYSLTVGSDCNIFLWVLPCPVWATQRKVAGSNPDQGTYMCCGLEVFLSSFYHV